MDSACVSPDPHPALLTDVQSLGIFPEDNHVYVGERGVNAGQALGRSDVAEQVKLLTQGLH